MEDKEDQKGFAHPATGHWGRIGANPLPPGQQAAPPTPHGTSRSLRGRPEPQPPQAPRMPPFRRRARRAQPSPAATPTRPGGARGEIRRRGCPRGAAPPPSDQGSCRAGAGTAIGSSAAAGRQAAARGGDPPLPPSPQKRVAAGGVDPAGAARAPRGRRGKERARERHRGETASPARGAAAPGAARAPASH